jgi:chromosome segregation ATPase
MSDPAFSDLNSTDGISDEDRREIMLEIEKVAGENRIILTENLFQFKPRKNGAAFPVLVNIAGVFLLAAGIAAFLFLFRTGEAELIEQGRAVITSESILIEEIRRATQEELAAKDAEIASIQTRISEIDAERSALAGNLETRVAQREAELRRELEAELEAERQRLRSLNLSEQEIELRLASFAEVKEREFSQRLTQFRRETEMEQSRLVRELNQREAEYNRSLDEAARQREALQQESSQRLATMQQEFEAERAAGRAQLDEAQAELNRLAREQEQATFLGGQIRGLFQITADALRQDNHDMARSRLADLRRLLNDESVLRVPALREQRSADLMLTGLLESLIDLDQRFGSAEAERQLNQGALISRVQELVTRASEDAEAGRTDQAVSLYRQALTVIPAISESYEFLGDPDDTTVTAELAAVNQEAARLITEAERATQSGNYNAAMTAYGAVLRDYPRSRYRLDAVTGMEESFGAAMARDLTLQDSLTSAMAELEADRDALAAQVSATRSELETSRATVAQRDNEIARLNTRITTLQNQPRTSEADLTTLRNDLARTTRALEAEQQQTRQLEEEVTLREEALRQTEAELLEALEELAVAQILTGSDITTDREVLVELSRLQALEGEIIALREEWSAYRSEASRLSDADSMELLSARVSLERFFSTEAMQRYFPEMSVEVGRFYDAFAAGGRENALLDASDILLDLTYADNRDEQVTLVRQARTGAEPALADFLVELEGLLLASR